MYADGGLLDGVDRQVLDGWMFTSGLLDGVVGMDGCMHVGCWMGDACM